MIELTEARIRQILAAAIADMEQTMSHAEKVLDVCERGDAREAMRRDGLRIRLAIAELPGAIAARSPFRSTRELRAVVDEEVRNVLSKLTSAEMTLRALGIPDDGAKA